MFAAFWAPFGALFSVFLPGFFPRVVPEGRGRAANRPAARRRRPGEKRWGLVGNPLDIRRKSVAYRWRCGSPIGKTTWRGWRSFCGGQG